MRVKPNIQITIGLFVAYAALVAGLWAALDIDYDSVQDNATTVREGIVYPIGAGAILLAVAATALGWWRPSLFERPELRIGPNWATWVIPGLLTGAVLLNLATVGWDDVAGDFVLWLAIGCLLVGFSEELLTRGLMIVGARGSLPERWVWVYSSAMFGLLHGLNAFFGQSGVETARQMVFAFALGATFYVVRRATGTLLVTMLLHAGWDFGTLGNLHTDDTALGGGLLIASVVCAAVVLWRTRNEAGTPIAA